MQPSVQQPISKDKNVMKILFKKQLFDLEVKGQGPTKVITVRDTPSYGHAPTPKYHVLSRKTKMSWPGKENTL